MDVTTHPPVQHARDGALLPVLGHAAAQSSFVRDHALVHEHDVFGLQHVQGRVGGRHL